MPRDKLDYELLRQLTEGPSASQRGLAERLGVSVGKCWVKVNNFRRSDNKWGYAYLLTPSGAVAKLRLTRDFLASKEREFQALQAEIAALRTELTAAQRPDAEARSLNSGDRR